MTLIDYFAPLGFTYEHPGFLNLVVNGGQLNVGEAGGKGCSESTPADVAIGVDVVDVEGGETLFTKEFQSGGVGEAVEFCKTLAGGIPEAIAAAFVADLRASMTPEEFQTVRNANAAESNPEVCHSHDVVDANLCMESAFGALGIEFDAQNDSHSALWAKAWAIARAGELTTDEPLLMPDFKSIGFDEWETGGGCKALGYESQGGETAMLTAYDEAMLPGIVGQVSLGVYDAAGEQSAIVHFDNVRDAFAVISGLFRMARNPKL